MKLADKVAVVTGSSRGIGRGIALRFAEEGADVVVNYLKRASDADSVVREIREKGRRAIAVQGDVALKRDAERIIEAGLQELGRLDILVNNAGFSRPVPFMDLTEETWDAVMGVNAKAIFLCTQRAARQMMRSGGGSIITVTSISGREASRQLSHYCAAKAAANMLTQGMAAELAPYGIRVNAIAAGLIETELSRTNILRDERLRRAYNELIPAGRPGTVDEIARAAVFLASADASYVTGHVLVVDGGWSAVTYDPGFEMPR